MEIFTEDYLTPTWLTDVLKSRGYLQRGCVESLQIIQIMQTPPSQLVQFTVTYSVDTVRTAPSNFFLIKLSKVVTNPAGLQNRT